MENKKSPETFDEMIERMKNEKDGETSWMPLIMCITAVLSIITGGFIYFPSSQSYSRGEFQMESLLIEKIRYLTLCMAAYCIPLFFASRTPYQRRKKSSAKTFTVLALMALFGFFLITDGIVGYINIHKDTSPITPIDADVKYSGYSTGSSRSTGNFYIDIVPAKQTDMYSVKISKELYDTYGRKKKVTLNMHSGYFGKKWFTLVP